ncbi:MAG: T9SS type A sorting domain-containing protein [Bacteroidales bacterium]|nr:T9SS type A sorting domain-containing protein [Bacteroidales bacterium]
MKHSFVALIMATVLISCVRDESLPSESVNHSQQNESACTGIAHVYLSEEMTEMVEMAQAKGSLVTKSSGFNQVIQELGVTQMYRLFPYAGEYEPRTRAEGLHRWYVVRYSDDIPATKAQSSLEVAPGIELYEPVQKIKINDFNDLQSDLWGLYNTTLPGFDINVKPVWTNYTTGDPKVVVAVLDEGVDLRHEDLAKNTYTLHKNFVDDNEVIVAGSHGTHVAGTIAAVNNNGIGVASIAGGDGKSKGVSIMSCQIFKGDGGSGCVAAMKWAADNGAVISQNSWGYNFDDNDDGKLTGDELTRALAAKIRASDQAAVDYFIKYAGCDNDGNQLPDSPMKGGVVIFAAGNETIEAGAPAEYSEVIAVGSVASDGTRSTFSNFGDWVDICAPGTGIKSTLPANEYGMMSGTSMACPHVSGVAALLVSHFGGPGFTNEMLKEKLLSSANKTIISQAYKIGGLVDAYGAFVYGNDKAPESIEDISAAGRGNNLDMTLTVPADEDGVAAYGFLVLYDTVKEDVEASDENNLSNVTYTTFVPEAKAGEKITLTLSKLAFETEYHVKVIPYSYGRNYGPASEVMTTATTVNNAPVVRSLTEGPYSLLPSETIYVSVEASEPDGHTMTVKHIKGSDAESILQQPDGTWKLTIKGSGADMGTYTATIKAVDEYGLSTELGITYTIKENTPPVKLGEIDDILLTAKGKEFVIDMTKYVNDPDGEQLKYEAAVTNSKILHINAKGDNLIGTALNYGLTDVRLTAKDSREESVEFSFKVQVKDPSEPMSVYPNPVTDYVNIGTLEMAETVISIYNSTGKLMYEETLQVSGMEPARIDMSAFAPGTYVIKAEFGGWHYTQNIVKI